MKTRSKYFLLLFLAWSAISANAQLAIGSGANLVAISGASIVLNNTGLVNAGNISSPGSAIVFTGTAPAVSTSISSTSGPDNITINKTAGGMMLSGNIAISGTVQFVAGTLDLNGYNLDLGTTGTLNGESSNSCITGSGGGYVQSTATLNTPSAQNPGNLGLEITSAGSLGTTIIRRGHQQQSAINAAGNSIFRYFDVLPSNNTSLNANIKFYYLSNELAGIIETQQQLYTSANYNNTWLSQGVTSINTTSKYLVKNGINVLNRLTLGGPATALPLKLVNFTGTNNGSFIDLQWSTSNEQDISHFEVEKSADAVRFEQFITLFSSGNVDVGSNFYATRDFKLLAPLAYYRLKVVDKSGAFFYSQVIVIQYAEQTNSDLSLYPNPVCKLSYLRFNSVEDRQTDLLIINELGQTVVKYKIQISKGSNNLPINLSQLATGSYIIAIPGSTNKTIRFLKNK